MSFAADALTDADLAQVIKLNAILDNIGALDHIDMPIPLASASGSAGDGESLPNLNELPKSNHIDTLAVPFPKVDTLPCYCFDTSLPRTKQRGL